MICSFDLSHFANTLAHQVWSDYTANRSLIFSQVRATDGTMEHESMENLSLRNISRQWQTEATAPDGADNRLPAGVVSSTENA